MTSTLSEILEAVDVGAVISADTPVVPTTIVEWLDKLALLEGVPLTYLVCDARMLPPESIRFFVLDPTWVDALVDGAFSIGRSTTAEGAADRVLRPLVSGASGSVVSGFILRSIVVSGWPGLKAVALDRNRAALRQVRFETISKNILIGLYSGDTVLQTLKIHEPTESLHFGVESHPGLSTSLRYVSGPNMGQQIQSDGEPVFQASVFRNDAKLGKPNRVLKAHATAAAILDALAAPANGSYSGKMTSAEFALEMIKAADEVTYTTAT